VSISVGVLAFPMAHPVWGGNPWLVYRMVDALATQFPSDTFHLVFYEAPENEVSKANVGRLLSRHANVKSVVAAKGKEAIDWCRAHTDLAWGTVSGIMRTDALPQVFTLQDMRMFTKFRESYAGYLKHKAGLSFALKQAKVVSVISRTTRDEVLRFYPGKGYERKIDLVYIGVPAGFDDPLGIVAKRPPQVTTEHFITTIYDPLPQKRMELLGSITPLLDKHGWDLVCIGPLRGGSRDRVVHHPRVHYPGYAGLGDLPAYIKASSLFLFPSEYEGFGLPPYEAMSLGVPVLYNRRCAAFVECIGDATHSFGTDPELPAVLDSLMSSPERLRSHVDGCLGLVKRFDWAQAARQYMYLFDLARDRAGSKVDFSPGKDRPSIEAVAPAGGARP
jgi:glycosyltransferase involved in cell wall biosynthesis